MFGKNTEEGSQETTLFLTTLVHSWRRFPNPHYISYPTSSNFVQPPPPLPPPPHTDTHTHCSFFALFLWLNGWLCHVWCVILLNYIMDLNHMPSQSTLVPEGPVVCFMKQGVKFSDVWHLMWFYASILICYHKDLQHPQGPIDWHIHIYKYLLAPTVMCSQQLRAIHLENILLISKI